MNDNDRLDKFIDLLEHKLPFQSRVIREIKDLLDENPDRVKLIQEALNANMKEPKTYSDCYLYSKYPQYQKQMMVAIMQDPIIDKGTDAFKDVEYEVKRTRVSDALVRILMSPNTVLLDCDDPLPRAFKVFCARDMKSNDKKIRAFIDCTGVITKSEKSRALIVEETKLISHLINAAMCMVYRKSYDTIKRRNFLVVKATTCFAKAFTHIIDYLIKISIQESSKAKVLYLSAMYFLEGVMDFDEEKSQPIAKKIAEISDREASMLNMLMDKSLRVQGTNKEETNPFENIKRFVEALREVMHFKKEVITVDIIIERWMALYGVGTVFALEFFPALSAMMTDAYIGGYINNQRSIENICKTDMVEYAKECLSLIESIA